MVGVTLRNGCDRCRLSTLTSWVCPDSHDLNLSNRTVRTRMPGGVAGAQSIMIAPYADWVFLCV